MAVLQVAEAGPCVESVATRSFHTRIARVYQRRTRRLSSSALRHAGLAKESVSKQRLRAVVVAFGRRSHALLTRLDCPTDRLSRRGAAVENLSRGASLHVVSDVPPHKRT